MTVSRLIQFSAPLSFSAWTSAQVPHDVNVCATLHLEEDCQQGGGGFLTFPELKLERKLYARAT